MEYASRMLATNAATLHKMIHPGCEGMEAFPCLDHWHIGHQGNTKAKCPPANKPAFPRINKRRKRRSAAS